MRKEIWFDMDGTIADLYGVANWLEKLTNSNPSPYEMARPLVNMNTLAKRLHKAQKNGYQIGIVSWLAKNSNKEYDDAVTKAKQKWLSTHLKSVKWDFNLITKEEPKKSRQPAVAQDTRTRTQTPSRSSIVKGEAPKRDDEEEQERTIGPK